MRCLPVVSFCRLTRLTEHDTRPPRGSGPESESRERAQISIRTPLADHPPPPPQVCHVERTTLQSNEIPVITLLHALCAFIKSLYFTYVFYLPCHRRLLSMNTRLMFTKACCGVDRCWGISVSIWLSVGINVVFVPAFQELLRS